MWRGALKLNCCLRSASKVCFCQHSSRKWNYCPLILQVHIRFRTTFLQHFERFLQHRNTAWSVRVWLNLSVDTEFESIFHFFDAIPIEMTQNLSAICEHVIYMFSLFVFQKCTRRLTLILTKPISWFKTRKFAKGFFLNIKSFFCLAWQWHNNAEGTHKLAKCCQSFRSCLFRTCAFLSGVL